MWDQLDAERKEVYKKKTEAAKKVFSQADSMSLIYTPRRHLDSFPLLSLRVLAETAPPFYFSVLKEIPFSYYSSTCVFSERICSRYFVTIAGVFEGTRRVPCVVGPESANFHQSSEPDSSISSINAFDFIVPVVTGTEFQR